VPGRELERPDVYVVARILERLWRAQRPYGKTALQNAVRLNTRVYGRYLHWMSTRGHVVIRDEAGGERVVITAKGIETYRSLASWIADTVGNGRL
jgi:predicted transcriptional regulator